MRLMGLISRNAFGTPAKPVREAATPPDEIDNLCAKIEKLTDSNQHTQSVIELANFLKNTKYVKILNAINTIHSLEGGMPHPLSEYREEVKQELLTILRSKHGKSAEEQVNRCF